jgi:hydrogenase maturation protease
MQTECLVVGKADTDLSIRVRFLQLVDRRVGKFAEPVAEMNREFELVPSLEVDGRLYQSWQEATERDVALPTMDLSAADGVTPFAFSDDLHTEPIYDAQDRIAGLIERKSQTVSGEVIVNVEETEMPGLSKIRVLIRNMTPVDHAEHANRESALLSSLVSTHMILSVDKGEFVSLIDPPEKYKAAADACRNIRTYPVLAGENGKADCMLSSPIILYDHPQIADESVGDLFDGTEIDEILTLRIMTLTDDEKREMRSIDDRARQVLERTELMPEEQLLKMHGAIRGLTRGRKV